MLSDPQTVVFYLLGGNLGFVTAGAGASYLARAKDGLKRELTSTSDIPGQLVPRFQRGVFVEHHAEQPMDRSNSLDNLDVVFLAKPISDCGEGRRTVNPTSQLVGDVEVVTVSECRIEDSGSCLPRSKF